MVGDEYSSSISSPVFFNPRLNRGPSDFNVAHNLEINYTWEISNRQSKNIQRDGKPCGQCGSDHIHTNTVEADPVCYEVDLVN